jgi:hypothetical protein
MNWPRCFADPNGRLEKRLPGGAAPTEKRPLFTAHTQSGHLFDGLRQLCLTFFDR